MEIYSHYEGRFFHYLLKMEKYPFLNEVVARILRERREALGMSKKKLSEKALIERAYITGLEKGKWNVSLNVLLHLCEALQMKPEDFMHQVMSELEKKNDRSWPFLD